MTDDVARQIARLERRVEREREKRFAAEQIAEEGTRRLYDVNVELDGLLQERTNEIELARRDLVAAASWKAEFLDSLSHEVRTPLNGILGMMELLAGVVEDETHKLWFETAVASAERLDRMFSRLLAAIELENVTFVDALEPVEVSAIIDGLLSKWLPAAMRSGHLLVPSVGVPLDAKVMTIGQRLMDALDELLANATVHGRPGSVHFTVTKTDDATVFAIVDSGPGVDAELGKLLIQPIFSRAPEAWAADGSMGLGLGLARRTCDALGAVLALGPEGSGTCASITVPNAVAATATPTAVESGEAVESAEAELAAGDPTEEAVVAPGQEAPAA